MVRPVLLLGLIVFGMAIGWVAQLIVGGGKAVDWGQAIVAGFVGSFVGGLLVSLLAGDGLSLRPSGIIGSIVGAIIVVLIWNAIRRSRGNTGGAKGASSSKGHRR
jgi:uncharacterized membrane protein YeaQ/YmgE (transglycosylase-associated protein family)